MTVLNSSAGRNGFVRGVVSRRHGGVAFPLDLVRVVAGVVNRGGGRRRVAAEFRNYLVTDSDDLPVWRRDGRVVVIVATGARCYGLKNDRFSSVAAGEVGALDAPEWLPGGSVRQDRLGDEIHATMQVVQRGGA